MTHLGAPSIADPESIGLKRDMRIILEEGKLNLEIQIERLYFLNVFFKNLEREKFRERKRE